MTRINPLQRSLLLLAAVGLLFPPAATANSDGKSADPVIHDIRLDSTGGFRVVVVDAQGQPSPATQILLTQTGRARRVRITTDDAGRHTFRGLKGGSYQLETSEGVCLCRVWTAQAAPPNAAEQLLIVNDRLIQRGQRPIREMFRSDPILMTAVVAAAIAIPIAIHKSRDDGPPGS